MRIRYNASVYTAAGWRNVSIEADAVRLSPGMAQVEKVVAIDGATPAYGVSRTGARRQEYNGLGVAEREVGARKRISACEVVA